MDWSDEKRKISYRRDYIVNKKKFIYRQSEPLLPTENITEQPTLHITDLIGGESENIMRHLKQRKNLKRKVEQRKVKRKRIVDVLYGEEEIVEKEDDKLVYVKEFDMAYDLDLKEGIQKKDFTDLYNMEKNKDILNNWTMNIKIFTRLIVDDPYLIFEPVNEIQNKRIKKSDFYKRSTVNEFDFSIINSYVKRGNFLVGVGLCHSLPALKINKEIYKTTFSNLELHEYHRPPLILLEGTYELTKKDTCTSVQKIEDFNLNSKNKIHLFEHSEERPLILTKRGMVSKYEYFNGPVDSPFIFSIKAGDSIKSLSNNLYRAPIFPSVIKNYFLLSFSNEKSFSIQKINLINTVAQIFPSAEIFSPHSRKYSEYSKSRLKCTFNNYKQVTATEIDELFPSFSDGLKRKFLKEQTIAQNRGTYLFDKSLLINHISEEDVEQYVTPEDCCIHYSMASGEYTNYPVWTLTRNYLNGLKGKGMLDISGPGDPTGCDEAYSFHKNGNEPKKYTSEAQMQYRQQIDDRWEKIKQSMEKKRFSRPVEIKKEVTEEVDDRTLIIERKIKVGEEEKIEREEITNPIIIELYVKSKEKKTEDKKQLKCGACGEIGHMKTYRYCNRYEETAKNSDSEKRKIRSFFNDIILKSINKICTLSNIQPFLRPVSLKKFPNYRKIILQPIDISTIRAKARDGQYKKYEQFVDDLNLMKMNCSTYNGEDSELTMKAAEAIVVASEYKGERISDIELCYRILNS